MSVRALLACVSVIATAMLTRPLEAQGAARGSAQETAVRGAGQPAFGRVRGVVYDSLRNRPLDGATVLISGATRIATTSASGLFEMDSVPVGRRALTFSTPALDSLGLFTMGRDIIVTSVSEPMPIVLATPSFATIWRSLCPNARATRGDSGIVYGSVANAGNEQRLQGARIVFSWWNLDKQQNQVAIDRPVLAVRTDSVGNYYGCGLPLGMTVSIDVDAATMGSGPVEAMLDSSRIARRDFLVSSEMFVSDTARRAAGGTPLADGLGVRRRGTATVRGETRDAKGAIVPDVLITLPSADTTVRSGADGRFVLGGLPSGSQAIRARKLGHGPLATMIDLRPGRETEVSLRLPPATVLAKVNVRAERTSNRYLVDFESRKKVGFGYYVGQTELATKPDVVSAFQGLPAVQVRRRGALASVLIERGSVVCEPSFWLDGKPSEFNEVSMRRPEELYGIEVYSRAGTVPAQFANTNTCGAILVWTRAPR